MAEEATPTVILSAYPLSNQFRRRLEGDGGTSTLHLSLSELRRGSLASTLRQVSSLHGSRLLLACESREGPLLQPILESLAVAVRPRSIEVVHPDLSRSQLSRWHAAPALASLAGASVKGWRAVTAARRELRDLLGAPRLPVGENGSRRVLYLNGNLWIGLKVVVNELQAAGREVEMATFVEPIGVGEAVRTQLLLPPAPFGLPFETNQYRFHETMTRHLASLRPGDIGFVYQRMSAGNYSGVTVSRRL
jgi:hypothetical protein